MLTKVPRWWGTGCSVAATLLIAFVLPMASRRLTWRLEVFLARNMMALVAENLTCAIEFEL